MGDDYDWGYKNAAAMQKEMAGGGRVSIKQHTRAPRVKAPRMPLPQSNPAQMPPPPSIGTAAGLAHGGKVRKYAAGGKVVAGKKPPAPTPPSKDTPKLACGGKVKGMAKGGKWIAGATKNKGKLHRALGVPEGTKIPAKKLAAGAKSKSPTVRKEVTLAKTLKSFKK